MPGIGLLPIGMLTAFNEMPAGMFADDGSGIAESPAGMFAGSSFVSLFAGAFAFGRGFDPQPKLMKIAHIKKTGMFLNIL